MAPGTVATSKTQSRRCAVGVRKGLATGVRNGEPQGPYLVAEIVKRDQAGKGACIEGMAAASWGSAAIEACCPFAGQAGHDYCNSSKHA